MKTLLFTIIIGFTFAVSVTAQNQYEMISGYTPGKYTVYKLNTKNKFEKVNKAWPISFETVNGNVQEVLVKRSGILDELFKEDVTGYPAYYGYKTYRLSFLKDFIVYYEWNGKQEAIIKYVFVPENRSFSMKWEDANEMVENYATTVFSNQGNARANAKEEKAALAEAERKKNSIENKVVSNIEIQLVASPKNVAHFGEAIAYGVIATLKDGSQLKSPNLGGKLPWSDFELKHIGCSNTIERVRVDESAATLKNDEVLLSVVSKYHPSLTAKKVIPTTNDVSIKVNQNGFWGSNRHKYVTVLQGRDGQHAGSADNLTIKITTVRHKHTGVSLNKIEIYNDSKEKLVAQYKLTPDTELIVNAIGGRGMDGFDGNDSRPNGGNGGNGGAGGNITVIKDPSVKKVNLTLNNQGGKGGNGGKPRWSGASRGRNGIAGEDGTISTKIQSVSLNF